ncbi:MAG: alpha/beta fold hydrolase [Solirubrobacteraceae bacterium]
MRVEEHTIEVAGSPVFYRSAGSDLTADTPVLYRNAGSDLTADTPVLYLHGAPTSADDWTPFLELTGGIAPDLPGFGRTAKGGHLDYSIDGHADFLERFLHQLGVDRVALVAHDWGAAGGLAFAQRHPERIQRLVLINALPLLDGFTWHRTANLARRPVLGELVVGSVNRWLLARALRHGAVRPDAWSDERVDAVWEQFDQGTQRALLRLHRCGDPRRLAAAGADLGALDMPALVLWGERDPWLDPGFADAYGERLPRARVTRIADAGHWPWLDQPQVIDEVAAFLKPA